MNVDRGSPAEMGPALWERHDMREALASRDIAAVYRRLQACGVSQRRIAARTGQSAAEVYEILNGRQVMAYDVLVRIADGPGVPRGYLGLAYDEVTEMALGMVTPRSSVRFFGPADLHALTGMAYSELFRDQAVGLARAVEEFGASLAARGPEMTLAPLESAARARQSGHDDLRDLAERIAALRAA